VEITLESDKDDAQAIFESINSTGKDLTVTDKMRNYLLMNPRTIEEQHYLHTHLWKPLEENLGEQDLEHYFYDFLVMQTEKVIKESELYEKYKEYIEIKCLTKEDALNELLYYSKFYLLLLGRNNKYCKELNEVSSIFKEFRHNTIYSFLLHICDDNEKEIINKNTLLEIFNFFANYALRRLITNVPSSSLRRFYAGLYNKIFKFRENKNTEQKYLSSITTYLCTINTADKFPSDTKFKTSLQEENIYTKGAAAKFLLEKIENNVNGKLSKEKIQFENLTIEHIMPQTLTSNWEKCSAKIIKKFTINIYTRLEIYLLLGITVSIKMLNIV
jgi:uncharacterized protein with ParB-like and HNH nuclease domain